ncbi:MAG: cobalamin biosynthesis protein [candidate division FCPU426 bacterium]
MRLAIIAITKHGVGHAMKLRAAMPDAALFVSEKQKADGQDNARYFGTIKDLTAEIWETYEGIVYIVSLGAVVRTIAPFLKNKDVDPAVIVVDDACRFAISVLSGHVGGANEATEAVAKALGATAVITTASDVRATIPVDILGRELGWVLEDKANVTPVSAAVVNDKPVSFIQECGEKNWWTRPQPLPKNITVVGSIAEAPPAEAYLLVSDRATELLKAELATVWDKVVIYRPKTLSLGMGCDFGADLEELEGLVDSTLLEAGLSKKCVRGLASIDIKEREEALLQLAEKLGVGIDFFTRDALNARGTISTPNPVVEKYTGAVGVSEPSAMLAAGTATLLVAKHKSKRATLAVARKEF